MENKFQHLIDKEKYQVIIFGCPSNIPFNFALHPWFVVNKQGSISRWEVLFRKIRREKSWGHLYMNFFPPFQGIEILPFSQKYFWKGKLLGQIEGDVAKRMAEFIENSPTKYPYCDKYFLSGPNSNTYAQWILNNFLEFKVRLPWNSFGQNYEIL
ncbi:MAG: hypothetical protein A3D65_03590 [Candidatus Lloydbacteria bacterium RIFCSPHIGHO2_02_FULL_50_13]|uniref:Uncharacterized protein n=1 Tax=Candidatus Lloydbacteria bacterium RIFCSPHIGHO2_02_FULL_50_13 TaxID=1798661 RepID=A0A1G2D0I4_9BACT|nr:MAG: hypothetical protein A3D65_03590 [Candidatus Lloydbacteria bacterium RIFCSPHIGHO2_02_FULL_50_13]